MDSVNLIVVLVLHVLVCFHFHCSDGDNQTMSEEDLHWNLFKNYNPDIVPRKNKSQPIWVDLEFFLMAVDDVNEKKQTLAARAFLEVIWTDERLTWNPDNYSDVTTINVKNEDIWMPDLSLSGTLDKLLDIGQEDGRAIVSSEGKVTMWPYKLYNIACKISITKFPIDEQKCVLDFLSWTNPTTAIRFKNPSGRINMKYLSESGEWDAVSLETDVSITDYGVLKWEHVYFNLLLRRKWLFYAMNSMAPVVCISLLNVLCFLLPAQSGERVTLCISIFLTLAVFLTVINNSMPESSEEVAVFGVYIGLQLIGSALTIFSTVVSIYLFHKDDSYKVPLPIRSMTLCCFTNREKPYTLPVSDETNGTVSNGHSKQHELPENPKVSLPTIVTWKMVSIVLDRVCLVLAVCWHAILNMYLIIQLNI